MAPKRGRVNASSLMRIRSAVWSTGRLARYQAVRLKPASRHAWTTLPPNVARKLWATRRRRAGLTRFFGGPRSACACRASDPPRPASGGDSPPPPQLAHAEVREPLLPDVEGSVADPELPADVRHGGPTLGLAHGVGDLLFTEFRLSFPRPGALDRQRDRSVPYLQPAQLFWGDVSNRQAASGGSVPAGSFAIMPANPSRGLSVDT